MNKSEEFIPSWSSAPGDTMLDILRQRNLSTTAFANTMGLTIEEIHNLIEGRATITITIARQLADVLGSSVSFWMSRDFQYRQDAQRLDADNLQRWIRELPLGDMIKFGWLIPTPYPSEEIAASLRFFAVSSVSAWRERYASLHDATTFRTSPSLDSRPASVATWLRRGEVEAEQIDCEPWHPERFAGSLTDIRLLSKYKDPNRFLPQLQTICSRGGVAVVIVRTPSGCRASGATRFVSREKAILQLSFRHLTDDHFWFTFFHEAGHLLLHGERNLFTAALNRKPIWILEGLEAENSEEEQQANHFAARCLIPDNFQQQLFELPISHTHIVRFAVQLGISPGIVVGQLQHLGRIGFDQMNSLKRRYTWDE